MWLVSVSTSQSCLRYAQSGCFQGEVLLKKCELPLYWTVSCFRLTASTSSPWTENLRELFGSRLRAFLFDSKWPQYFCFMYWTSFNSRLTTHDSYCDLYPPGATKKKMNSNSFAQSLIASTRASWFLLIFCPTKWTSKSLRGPSLHRHQFLHLPSHHQRHQRGAQAWLCDVKTAGQLTQLKTYGFSISRWKETTMVEPWHKVECYSFDLECSPTRDWSGFNSHYNFAQVGYGKSALQCEMDLGSPVLRTAWLSYRWLHTGPTKLRASDGQRFHGIDLYTIRLNGPSPYFPASNRP